MLRYTLICALVLCQFPTLAAQEPQPRATMERAKMEDDQAVILFNWWVSTERCPPESIRFVHLGELLSAPDTYLGSCVQTGGFYAHRALFSERKDLTRQNPAANPTSADRRLGLYGDETKMEALDTRHGERVLVTGLISSCEALPDEHTIMLMGYCHYTEGPVLGLLEE